MKRLLGGLVLLAAGCASTSPNEPFRHVASAVEQSSGETPQWTPGAPEDRRIDDAIDRALAGELTAPRAVQVALLNNHALRATYEELSISQADLVQAGLLKNPQLSVGSTVAEGDLLSPNLELGLVWPFLDLLMLPARKKIAATELEATELRVTDRVLDVVADVERSFFELAAAEQVATMRTIVADAAEASAELRARQNAAGNTSDLTLATEQASSEQLALDLARAQSDAVAARERLVRLLGLWGPRASLKVIARLPEVPATEPPLDHLEALAVARRADLAAMRKEREALGRTLSLAKSTRYTPGVDVGVGAGRLRDGNVSVAPSAGLELPIFDQHQAVVAHLEALFRAADERLRDRAVQVRSDVRAARARMDFARSAVARYRDTMIPLRERVVALAQEQYDAMLIGAYPLLAAKQAEANAYREAIEAARDYWVARVDLERAIGGRIEPRERPTVSDRTSEPRSRP